MSFTTDDSENKATDSSRLGKVGSGLDDRLMGSDEVRVVSVGGSEGCSVGGSNEGLMGGLDGSSV